MKILIADDDRFIRFSVRAMLEELGIVPSSICEAKDGEELVDICLSTNPDIAFVDINMPAINGINAIEKCKNIGISTKFIVLTAYAEFEYARKSIQIGVTDYLLKPVSLEQLEKIVEKSTEEILQKRKENSKEFQLYVINSVKNPYGFFSAETKRQPSDPSADKLDTRWGGFVAACLINLDYPNNVGALISHENIYNLLNDMQEDLLADSIYMAVSNYSKTHIQLFTVMKSIEHADTLKDRVNNFCKALSQQNILAGGLLVASQSFKQVKSDVQFLAENPSVYLLFQLGAISNFSLKKFKYSENDLSFISQIVSLAQLFRQSNELKYSKVLSLFKSSFQSLPAGIHLPSIAKYIVASTGENTNKEDYKTFLTALEKLKSKMPSPQNDSSETKISKIQKYIDENYMYDISIAYISERFGFTPNYLSMLFNKKTGYKFIDYLTEVRINNAKKIVLQAPDITIKELSERVGYTSTRHFTKLFKKYVGYFPSEYKKLEHTKDKT